MNPDNQNGKRSPYLGGPGSQQQQTQSPRPSPLQPGDLPPNTHFNMNQNNNSNNNNNNNNNSNSNNMHQNSTGNLHQNNNNMLQSHSPLPQQNSGMLQSHSPQPGLSAGNSNLSSQLNTGSGHFNNHGFSSGPNLMSQRDMPYNYLNEPGLSVPGQYSANHSRPPSVNTFGGQNSGYLGDQLLSPMYPVGTLPHGSGSNTPVPLSPQILSPRGFDPGPHSRAFETPRGFDASQTPRQFDPSQTPRGFDPSQTPRNFDPSAANRDFGPISRNHSMMGGPGVSSPQLNPQALIPQGDGSRPNSNPIKRQPSANALHNLDRPGMGNGPMTDGKITPGGVTAKKRKTRGNNNTNGRVYDFVDKSQEIRSHLVGQLGLEECIRLDRHRELGMSSLFEIIGPLDYKDLIFSEEFLVKKVKRVQELFDVVGAPAFAFRRLGDLVACNEQFCHLFNMPRKDVLDFNFIKLFHRDDIVELAGELSNKLALFFHPNQVIRNIRLVHPVSKNLICGRASLRIIRDVFELPCLYTVIMLPDKTGTGEEDTYGNGTVIVR